MSHVLGRVRQRDNPRPTDLQSVGRLAGKLTAHGAPLWDQREVLRASKHERVTWLDVDRP